MKIVGQDKLLNLINSKTRSTFPRSLILLGEWGSGKHTLCQHIKEQLCIDMLDITDTLNLATINELYQRPEPYLYVIDGTKITVKEQNIILKFVEEPLKNAYIIILAESKSQLLNTVLNRCQVWTISPYSKEVLKTFTQDEGVLEIANTPGLVLSMLSINQYEVTELANKLIEKIGIANPANVLNISDKMAYKNEKDKINIEVFAKVLLHQAVKYVLGENNKSYIDTYLRINKWVNERKIPNVNQRCLFETFLIDLHKLRRG